LVVYCNSARKSIPNPPGGLCPTGLASPASAAKVTRRLRRRAIIGAGRFTVAPSADGLWKSPGPLPLTNARPPAHHRGLRHRAALVTTRRGWTPSTAGPPSGRSDVIRQKCLALPQQDACGQIARFGFLDPAGNLAVQETLIRYSPFANLFRISAWLARVIGYQIRSGRATTKKRAGTSPKNKRMPKRVCALCGTLGT